MMEFNVQPDQLAKHAGTVADLAAEARGAAAVAELGLSGDAFGVLGQFLAAAILQASGEAKEGVARTAQTIADVNTGLLASVKAYQDIDRRHARALGGIKP